MARHAVTPERIAQVALDIVDAEGTSAVTMRRVAAALGVQAPSLYAHVRGRAEILQLVHDVVMAEVGPLEHTGDWQHDLREYFVRMHQVLRAHGDAAALQFGAIPSNARSATALLDAIAELEAAGLPRLLAMRGIERLSLYVTADAYEQWEFRRRAALGEQPNPAVVNLYSEGDGGSVDAFAFGLDLLLDGLDAAARET